MGYYSNKKIKLMFSGSGTLFYCQFGVLKYLIENGYNIEEIGGVSGGFINAAFYSSIKSIKKIEKKLLKFTSKNMNMTDFSLIGLTEGYGLFEGNAIEKILKQEMKGNFGNTKIPLVGFTTNLSEMKQSVWSTKETPSQPIYKVVRASMSIPVLFDYVNFFGKIHIDGGLCSNEPFNYFPDDKSTFCVKFKSSLGKRREINNIADYIVASQEIMVEYSSKKSTEQLKNSTIIEIDTKHNYLDFNITEEKIKAMIDEGYQSAKKQLSNK